MADVVTGTIDEGAKILMWPVFNHPHHFFNAGVSIPIRMYIEEYAHITVRGSEAE